MSSFEEQLNWFGTATSVVELVDAGSPLLKTSAASKAARSEQFAKGLTKLIKAQEDLTGAEQLKALAFAWRLTSVSAMRRHRKFLIDELGKETSQPTELPIVLDDPDDRRNLFEALKHKSDDWLPSYLVRSITNDRDGSSVRGTAAETLILKQKSLVDTIEGLTAEFKALRLDQKDPDTGRARVLVNNLSALSSAMWNNPDDLLIGQDFGSTFKALVSSATFLDLDDRNLRIEIAKSVINFFLIVARLDVETASAAENYAFVRPLKNLFRPADWPDELTFDLRRLAKLAGQRLIFLLIRGRPNNQLRMLVLELLGPVAGAKFLSVLADDDAALTEEQLFWLAKGKAREGTSANENAEASVLARFDRDLGELMRSADIVQETVMATSNQFDSEADLLPESTADAVRRFISRSLENAKTSLHIAEQRGLKIEGRVGEVVKFDPSIHNPSATAVGEDTVRMVSRIVLRELIGGRRIVVLKADVDKA